ncbi:MAG: tetratricopeptide repeat protein [Chloroflexales bacterium]|nr:tetratricopeptide repeat protein [Chloroflexales bacterium]
MTNKISFGRWLSQRRRVLDLTQADLARLVGCSLSTITKIEVDARRPSKQIVAHLISSLDIPAEHQEVFRQFARQSGSPAQLEALLAPQDSRSAQAPPINLPARLAPLVGRDDELTALRNCFLHTGLRLITLIGPPGVGKTSLALHAAADLDVTFPDGVFFIALAPVAASELVVSIIAQTLGVKDTGLQSLAAELIGFLKKKRILLLLDNCEHLLAAASFFAEILVACPDVCVLATSRAPLRLRGEHAVQVPPLALPDLSSPQQIDAIAHSPAVTLLLRQAQLVVSGLALTAENAATLAAICHYLNGLPLAIELCAPRLRVLSPQELLRRLRSDSDQASLRLLRNGPRDLPTRQQTLENAIAWSYRLLQPDEQVVFASLAVFAGGGTLAAAMAVCSDFEGPFVEFTLEATSGHTANSRLSVSAAENSKSQHLLDVLTTLVDNNLVLQQVQASGDMRFTMLELLRAYAHEQLHASGKAMTIQRRHAAYYLSLAEAAKPHLQGPAQNEWLDRLEAELANLRAAFQWMFAANAAEMALRLGGALVPFWRARGHSSEGRQFLARTLTYQMDVPVVVRAEALRGAGVLAFEQDDYGQARAYFEACLALREELGETGDIARTVANLGLVAYWQGDYQRAVAWFEEGLALERKIGNKNDEAGSSLKLGMALLSLGDRAGAMAFLDAGLALYQASGHQGGIGMALNFQGRAALYQGDYARAAALCEASLDIFQPLGHKAGSARAYIYLGRAVLCQGAHAQAAYLLHEGLQHLRKVGDKEGMAVAFEGLAGVAVAQNQATRAARLYGAAESLRTMLGAPWPAADRAYYEQLVAAIQAQLDETTWAAQRTIGRAMTLIQALDNARSVGE